MFINPAFAQATTNVAAGGSMTGMIVQLLLIFAIFYIIKFTINYRNNEKKKNTYSYQ